jgi:hypothetical protein
MRYCHHLVSVVVRALSLEGMFIGLSYKFYVLCWDRKSKMATATTTETRSHHVSKRVFSILLCGAYYGIVLGIWRNLITYHRYIANHNRTLWETGTNSCIYYFHIRCYIKYKYYIKESASIPYDHDKKKWLINQQNCIIKY